MPSQKAVLPENLYLEITIDGREFNSCTSLSVKHEINSARTVRCQFEGREALEMCRLGGEVTIKWHKNAPNSATFSDSKSFKGIIKSIKPGENTSIFTAFDYITHLAESQFSNYKLEDYLGEDLYFAAARACDYKGMDVSKLQSGSGIFITKDMDLFGWKTRKEFIDACFNEMKILIDDGQHPRNTINQWYYSIRKDNIMDFFLPDPNIEGAKESFTVSENNGNISGQGLVSLIDNSQMVNAITVVSSTDEAIYAQIEDGPSVDRHGISSTFVLHNTTNEAELYNVGYTILNNLNKPSIYYNITMDSVDDVTLGDLIKVQIPSVHAALYASTEILAVIGYELHIVDSISIKIQLGKKPLTVGDMIDLMKKPTDR